MCVTRRKFDVLQCFGKLARRKSDAKNMAKEISILLYGRIMRSNQRTSLSVWKSVA
jgi:hypothetical protein